MGGMAAMPESYETLGGDTSSHHDPVGILYLVIRITRFLSRGEVMPSAHFVTDGCDTRHTAATSVLVWTSRTR